MKVKKSESGAGGEIYNKCQWREIMKIRTGANQRINEGEKRKKKKKSRNRRHKAVKWVTSPSMENSLTMPRTETRNPFQGWKST